VEKCCHYFNLMDLILREQPTRVFASGAQRVNHLNESYGGRRPDILDSAYVIVEYPSGARAMLDLCMFAENSVDNEQVSVVGHLGKVEALVTEGVVRVGRRADGIGRVTERPVADEAVRHVGLHHGASYLEHVAFRDAVLQRRPAAVTLDDGLWSVAVGEAAHRSIDAGRPVELSEVLA